MDSSKKQQLWNPSLGIRFSPSREPVPLYPILDMSRYVHTSSDRTSEPRVGMQYNQEGLEALSSLDEVSAAQYIPEPQSTTSAPDSAVLDASEDPVPLNDELIQPQVEPPTSSLSYQISPERFQKASESPKDSPGSFWSHTMYRRIREDGTVANVKVHYCRTKHTMENVCRQYFLDKDILGFDMEWQPNTLGSSGVRQNVSIIQLASESHIGLFHLSLFPKDDFVAPSFREIMENPNISKTGVNIRADCTRLKKYLDVKTCGIFELSHLYKVVKYSQGDTSFKLNKNLVSLATQVKECLRLPLFKGDSVRTSDWTRPLNERQIMYSASDAYAGVQLYAVLEEQRRLLDPTPPRPYHAELNRPLQLGVKVEERLETEPITVADSNTDTVNQGDQVLVEAGENSEEANKDTSQPSLSNGSACQSGDGYPVLKRTDYRLHAAEARIRQYRLSKRTAVKAPPSHLRAYYVWHDNENLKPESVARVMRDPPLALHTVLNYIIGAVAAEGLPFSHARMRDEVLSFPRTSFAQDHRYQKVLSACQNSDT